MSIAMDLLGSIAGYIIAARGIAFHELFLRFAEMPMLELVIDVTQPTNSNSRRTWLRVFGGGIRLSGWQVSRPRL
jgi:hypothetical protein